MSEIVATYHLDNPWDAHPMDRGHFYDEQIEEFKKTGKPSRAVGVFNVLLFTGSGEMILQKRSHGKRHNPYLIDKAVGGHIQYGDTVYYTAMIECVQELRIPAIVLREGENIGRTFELINKSTETVAILKHITHKIIEVDKIMDGERIKIANNVDLFFGLYSGAAKPVDREASGVLYYEMDVLRDEMKKMPDLFTPDLHYYMTEYAEEIEKFLKVIK